MPFQSPSRGSSTRIPFAVLGPPAPESKKHPWSRARHRIERWLFKKSVARSPGDLTWRQRLGYF